MAEVAPAISEVRDGSHIGRHIIVYGPTGSGKTAVARQIGEVLRLPIIELDALFHGANWKPAPEHEFRKKVRDALDRNDGGWVCDGNYTRLASDLTLPLADTVVWLRLPFWVTFWRLLKRTIARLWTKELLWETNRESFRRSFLSKDSILLWAITDRKAGFTQVRRVLKETPHSAKVVELRSTRDVTKLLTSLTEHSQGA